MEESARLSQAEHPSYNIIAPNGKSVELISKLSLTKLFSLLGPGTYAFGYEIEDPATKNVQFRDEKKLRNGTVIGSYGVLFPDDTLQITKYIADQFGYR